jgi:hypothetical protein
VAITHRADDIEVVLAQEGSQAFGDDRLVVGEEDVGSARHA